MQDTRSPKDRRCVPIGGVSQQLPTMPYEFLFTNASCDDRFGALSLIFPYFI